MRFPVGLGLIGLFSMIGAAAESWPEVVQKVEIPAASDAETAQPALFWKAKSPEPRPLLVALHTWSGGYDQTGSSLPYWRWCQREGWHFLQPHFQGPNRKPNAMGSDTAVEDIVRAVQWARENCAVDEQRVYLIGVSGGGHMAMLMAGRHPEMWTAVSAWCGISDIAAWHRQCTENSQFGKYAKDIEAALGGAPEGNAVRQKDAAHRSPLTFLAAARGLPLDLAAGLHDGRAGSVPFSHSLRAFDGVAEPEHRLEEAGIEAFYSRQVPPEIVGELDDPTYPSDKAPRFRRISGNCRVTIFEGGHEIVHSAALNWLAAQRRGQTVVWRPAEVKPVPVSAAEGQSGL
ncbi:MAG: prolyl oligopeptidase family serine peptidase [Verrucomicrobiales bacterium]|nr:prolyl oligopeptidase family serine peptidase [Verrucomicrobiales bacterium]